MLCISLVFMDYLYFSKLHQTSQRNKTEPSSSDEELPNPFLDPIFEDIPGTSGFTKTNPGGNSGTPTVSSTFSVVHQVIVMMSCMKNASSIN